MPSLNGITVNIFSEGMPLEEYSTSLDPYLHNSVVCWVPSSKDKIFSIKYQFLSQESWDWTCGLSCDGLEMRCSHVRSTTKIYEHDKARNGNTLCPMIFTELIETDNHEVADKSVNPLLGTIEVKVWRRKNDRKDVPGRLAPGKGFTIDESPIHESKKILGGHRVRLGRATPSIKTVKLARYLDAKLFAAFKFHYRPISVLQALGHVPPSALITTGNIKRSNSVISLSSSSSDSDSDSVVKKAKIAALTAELASLQRAEGKHHRKREAKGAKNGRREAKRLKTGRFNVPGSHDTKGEIIDLCSD